MVKEAILPSNTVCKISKKRGVFLSTSPVDNFVDCFLKSSLTLGKYRAS